MAVSYEASQYAFCEPMRKATTLKGLPEAQVTGISTLYVPPKGVSPLDEAMMERLGMSKDSIKSVSMEIYVDPVGDEAS